MNSRTMGVLYGIGVGPGDPELIPLKSINILKEVEVIYTASSTKNSYSRAVEIASPFIPDTARLEMLSFPMTKDLLEKQTCWEPHAKTIIELLETGRDAAFLTLGDPLTYATYGYILKNIQRLAPHAPVVTIPGITSFQAAAARVNTPLVEGDESLVVISGVEGGQKIRELSATAENMVIMKAYKNVEDITNALEESGRMQSSIGIANCSLTNEEVVPDVRTLKEKPPGYWTLIISKNGNDAQRA